MRSRPQKRLLAVLTLTVFFSGLCLGTIALLQIFRVRHIVCTEAGEQCDTNILSFFSGYTGKGIFQPFQFDIPGKEGKIRVQYPDTLVVTINTPKSIAHIFVSEQKSVTVFSDGTYTEDGSVIDPSDVTVRIFDPTLGQSARGTLPTEKREFFRAVLDMQSSLPLESVRVLSDSEIELQTSTQLTAIVSLDHWQSELHSLQVILYSPTIEKKPARVDLRFERPVLRYL